MKSARSTTAAAVLGISLLAPTPVLAQAQSDEAVFSALLAAASRKLQSPAAPFDDEEGTPPNLDSYGFDNWLTREQPGLAREYVRLDADARRQVYARYRVEPTIAAIRDAILARSRP